MSPENGPAVEPPPPSGGLLRRVLASWRKAPVLVRVFAVILPLLALARISAPGISLPTGGANSAYLAAAVKSRATVDLREDFQAGFSSWSGKPGWEKTWSLDGSASAQPGRLALFNPSVRLSDYRFEFQAQILSKALGVALRAGDPDNYQAIRLVVAKPGPLSGVSFIRYPVIAGKEGPKTQSALSLTVGPDTLYKVLIQIEEDHVTVTVNGVLADAWSDARFKTGGIGFFAEKGEAARVRAVHVIDKDDFLGWLSYQVSRWTADIPGIGATHE
ncbi:MAG TPA: hypothetical protein VL285_08795 [Bryobacteraceae bacterium]|nr:hypothetical protein [Bryobacteraceae bacterium]